MPPLRLLGALALLLAPLATAQTTPDVGFGDAGTVSLPGAPLSTLAVQPDGAVLAASFSADRPALRRLTADGAPDPTFGIQGRVVLPIDDALLVGLAVQPNGFLVAVGARRQGGDELSQFAVRLTPSGALDAGFGAEGVLELAGVAGFPSVATTAMPDGGFVVAWSALDIPGVLLALRFGADGEQDVDYGNDGFAALISERLGDSYLSTALADADGRLYLVGSAEPGTDAFSVFAARLLPDGTADGAYGTEGLATVASPVGYSVGQAAVLGPDGLVVAGYDVYNPEDPGGAGSAFFALRLRADGTPDPAFGAHGLALFRGPAGDGAAKSVALDAEGRVLLGGGFGDQADGGGDAVLVRLLADGRPDPTFGEGGFARLTPESEVVSLLRLADGRWLAGGSDAAGTGFVSRFLDGSAVSSEPGGAGPPAALVRTGPNPARGRTTFRLVPPAHGVVRVSVLDALGRTVAVLHDGPTAGPTAGPLDLALDASALAPGVYHVRADGAGSAPLRLTVVR